MHKNYIFYEKNNKEKEYEVNIVLKFCDDINNENKKHSKFFIEINKLIVNSFSNYTDAEAYLFNLIINNKLVVD